MFKKSHGMRSPKFEPTSQQRSAYEDSIHSYFQLDLSHRKTTVPKAGDICPQCQFAKVDYNGMLNLSCPACGYTLAGCFT